MGDHIVNVAVLGDPNVEAVHLNSFFDTRINVYRLAPRDVISVMAHEIPKDVYIVYVQEDGQQCWGNFEKVFVLKEDLHALKHKLHLNVVAIAYERVLFI